MNNQLAKTFLKQSTKECVFCNPSEELLLFSSGHFHVMLDPFPLIPGHLLLTSREHYGCLGEVPDELLPECAQLRERGSRLLSSCFETGITRYEHGRAGHCMSLGVEERSCHHYHEHLIPAELPLHPLLESKFKSYSFDEDREVVEFYYRYNEYLLVAPSTGEKKLYSTAGSRVPPHLLRTLSAQALGSPHLQNWETYTSCDLMLLGKELVAGKNNENFALQDGLDG